MNFKGFLNINCFLVLILFSFLNIRGQVSLTNKTIYTIIDSINCDNSTLKVETTYLNDSVDPEERHLFIPVVLKQKFIFLQNGIILNTVYNTSKKINQKVSDGSEVLMLSVVYYSICIIPGKYKPVYRLNGDGGCNTCEEKMDFYTLDGKIPYKNNSEKEMIHFKNKYGINNESKCDRELVIYPPH